MQGLLLFITLAISQINAGTANATTIKDYIAAEATLVGAPVEEAVHIAQAETGFNTNAIGDQGTSVGAFQIHLPAHPDISKAQAENLVFATEWSVMQLKAGNCRIWSTCDTSLLPTSTTPINDSGGITGAVDGG